MDFGFTEGDADAQDGAFALGLDAQGDEHGAIQELAALADFFVAGVEHQVGKRAQGAGAPGLELAIQVGGALADLGRADRGAAELLDDGGDFAGGDALDIHFGQGQFEGLFAADALFQGAGIELDLPADLRDTELDGADAGVESLGFEAVGVALAGLRAFVGLGLEGLRAFLTHRFVDQEADAFGEAGGALLSEELQNGVQEFRIGLVGRHGFALDVFGDTPTGNHDAPPSTSFSRAERLPLPGPAALGSLRSPSLRQPRKGWRRRKEEETFTERVLHPRPSATCVQAKDHLVRGSSRHSLGARMSNSCDSLYRPK